MTGQIRPTRGTVLLLMTYGLVQAASSVKADNGLTSGDTFLNAATPPPSFPDIVSISRTGARRISEHVVDFPSRFFGAGDPSAGAELTGATVKRRIKRRRRMIHPSAESEGFFFGLREAMLDRSRSLRRNQREIDPIASAALAKTTKETLFALRELREELVDLRNEMRVMERGMPRMDGLVELGSGERNAKGIKTEVDSLSLRIEEE